MRKSFFALATLALLLAGCSKESLGGSTGEESLVKATFTANLNDGAVTRADADGDGQGTKATRCIMELYYGEDLYYREVQTVSDKVATFSNITLVSNRTYEVLFWADAGEKYYDAADLRAVKMDTTEYKANDDARDAFFYRGQQVVAQKGELYKVELRRPFAQMNIITLDAAGVKSEALYPETVKMVYTAPTQFNIYTGELSKEKEITCSGDVYAAFDAEKTALTLQMDYIFADTAKAMIDIAFNAEHSGDEDVVFAFTNIPYQRNFRTNIQGKLLTTTGNWTATIVPAWYGNGTSDEDNWFVNYIEAGSIAAANEALKTNNAVSIENPNDAKDPIVIPAEQDEKNVFINITGASVSTITIQNAKGADGPANIDIKSDSKDLIINCPNSHVEVNGGEYADVTATTSATTLVVGKDVTIENLEIKAGNAKIYGKVTNLTRANGVKADWYVDDRAKLVAGLDKSIAGESVVLTSDIDLNYEEWAPVTIGKAITFDGDKHTIKNLKIEGSYSDSHYGLIGYLYSNGVIKNLTIDGAQILLPDTKGSESRGAALVGIARDGDIINCHVKNVTVKAYQKVGGLIGQYSLEASGTSIVKDCSAEDVTISENQTGKGVWGAGGLIGSLCLVNNDHSIIVEGCSVKGITIANSTTQAEPRQTAHAFIGTIRDDAEAVVKLTGNTVEQASGLFTDIYSSEYFGWATNNEYNPSYKCQIIIDGEEWTPDYPVKIEGGKGYATLDDALSAATAGQTVQIIKAGEYKFPGQTKKAITVEGINEKDADGNYVVAIDLNGVSEYNESLTFKHLTFKFADNESQDRGFTHCVNMTYNECVFTGLMWGYDSQVSTFNNCLFHQTSKYNVWSYGGNLEFNHCTFESNGNFVNVYATTGCGSISEVKAVDCKFVNKNSSAVEAAFNIKGNVGSYVQHTHVIIENCTTQGLFPNRQSSTESTIYSDDGLWMFAEGPWEDAVYAKVDDITYYPYFTIDADGNYSVNNATGLKKSIKHWNALKAAGEKSITLADGDYNVSDMAIFQNYADKSLLIKAENEKQAVITPTTGSKQLIFVVAGMSKSYAGHIAVDGIKFDFSNASNKEIESDVISISDAAGTNLPADEKALYSGTYHYAHDITIENCEIIGLGVNNEHSSVVRTENQNGYNVKVQNCAIDQVGYVLTSKITTYAEVSGCKITNSKCVINNTVNEVEYKITGNTIDTWNNYCIRVDYGPLVVKNNTFNITWTPETGEMPTKHEPAVIALKASTGNEATITKDNTFSKASDKMYDVYCTTSWIVNGDTIPAGTGKNL